MSLMNGWIVPEGEEHFDELRGRRANVEHYFATPHRMLIIRLPGFGETQEPLFLLCTGVTRLETAPSWPIDDLRCSSLDANTILLDDKRSGFHVACHALRLFGAEEFKRWLGKDQYLIDPSANTLHTVLESGADAF